MRSLRLLPERGPSVIRAQDQGLGSGSPPEVGTATRSQAGGMSSPYSLNRERGVMKELDPATAAVELDAVSMVYGSNGRKVAALDALSLTFTRGTFTAIMGPSGSGKTTLLQSASGL